MSALRKRRHHERDAEIVRWCRDGETRAAVAATCGLTEERVRQILHEQGHGFLAAGRRGRQLDLPLWRDDWLRKW
jgi:hypothetical protein